MAKIHKFQDDITEEVANSLKESIAIDTEATGLQIPERDKLSLIQICDQNGVVYIIQPDRKSYKAPNLVSILEKILKRFYQILSNDQFLKCLHLLEL